MTLGPVLCPESNPQTLHLVFRDVIDNLLGSDERGFHVAIEPDAKLFDELGKSRHYRLSLECRVTPEDGVTPAQLSVPEQLSSCVPQVGV